MASKNDIVVRLRLQGANAYNKQAQGAAHSTEKIGTAGHRASKGMMATNRASTLGAGALKSAASAATGLAAGYVGIGAAKSAIGTTVELGKGTIALSRNLGLSTEQASRWAAVSRARGVDTDQLSSSFVNLSRQVQAARDGSGKAQDAFKALGINQKDLAKGSKDFQGLLGNVAEGMGKMEGGTKRAATAQLLLGRNSSTTLPIFTQGRKSMDANLKLADKYGVTLGGKPIKSLRQLQQAQKEAEFASMGMQVTFATLVAPALTKVIGGVGKFVVGMRSGKGAGGQLAQVMVGLWQGIKPVAVWTGHAAAALGRFGAKHPGLVKVAAAAGVAAVAIRKIPGGVWLAKHVLSGLGTLGAKLFVKLVGPEKAASIAAGRIAGNAGGKKIGDATASTLGSKGSLGKFAGIGRLMGLTLGVAAGALVVSEIEKKIRSKYAGGETGDKAMGTPGSYGGLPGLLKTLHIGGKALGGTIPRGGASWVGERGPELAIAGQSGSATRIMPAHQSRVPQLQGAINAHAGAGGGDVVIKPQVVLNDRVLAEAVHRYDRATMARR